MTITIRRPDIHEIFTEHSDFEHQRLYNLVLLERSGIVLEVRDMQRVVIEIAGGVLDGKFIDSESSNEREAFEARMVYWLFSGSLDLMERAEDLDRSNIVLYRQPSPVVAQQAREENWSEARIAAMMPYYNYEVTGWL